MLNIFENIDKRKKLSLCCNHLQIKYKTSDTIKYEIWNALYTKEKREISLITDATRNK